MLKVSTSTQTESETARRMPRDETITSSKNVRIAGWNRAAFVLARA